MKSTDYSCITMATTITVLYYHAIMTKLYLVVPTKFISLPVIFTNIKTITLKASNTTIDEVPSYWNKLNKSLRRNSCLAAGISAALFTIECRAVYWIQMYWFSSKASPRLRWELQLSQFGVAHPNDAFCVGINFSWTMTCSWDWKNRTCYQNIPFNHHLCFTSRFHIRRRTSRLDEQIVSKSSSSRTNHQMWKRVGQNVRRTSRLNLFDYLSVCEDDFWDTICSSRRLVRL